MSCLQLLLCILFPPLAVIDKGCGSILLVTLLSILGWIPGVIAALIIINNGGGQNIVVIEKIDRAIEQATGKENSKLDVATRNQNQTIVLALVLAVISMCIFCCCVSTILGSVQPN